MNYSRLIAHWMLWQLHLRWLRIEKSFDQLWCSIVLVFLLSLPVSAYMCEGIWIAFKSVQFGFGFLHFLHGWYSFFSLTCRWSKWSHFIRECSMRGRRKRGEKKKLFNLLCFFVCLSVISIFSALRFEAKIAF